MVIFFLYWTLNESKFVPNSLVYLAFIFLFRIVDVRPVWGDFVLSLSKNPKKSFPYSLYMFFWMTCDVAKATRFLVLLIRQLKLTVIDKHILSQRLGSFDQPTVKSPIDPFGKYHPTITHLKKPPTLLALPRWLTLTGAPTIGTRKALASHAFRSYSIQQCTCLLKPVWTVQHLDEELP